MKTCSKCNETKAVSDFNKASANKDGLQYHCKVCHKLARKPKEHISRIKSEWDVANREHINSYKREEYGRIPGQQAAFDVRKRGELSDIYDMLLCNEFYLEARRLTKETGILHEVDHIKPIAAGGLHCQTNLQVLTKEENMKKGSKWTSI